MGKSYNWACVNQKKTINKQKTNNNTKEFTMKNLIWAVLSCFLIVQGAIAANQASSMRHVVKGTVFFPGLGEVAANQVCFDAATEKYQYLRLETVVSRCLDGYYNYSNNYRDPQYICRNEFQETLPEKLFTAGTTYLQKVCASWDYTDSTRPVCQGETTVERKQITYYTIESYYDYDTRMDKPVITKVAIAKCQQER